MPYPTDCNLWVLSHAGRRVADPYDLVQYRESPTPTGVTKTEWDRRSKERELPYDVSMAIIEFADRDLLYSRIDRRVHLMMEAGLLCEVKNLFENGLLSRGKPAFQAIGYKEFIPYLEGVASLEECIAEVQTASRRYAKRQLTWFRRNPDINWIDISELNNEEILKKAFDLLENGGLI